MPGFSDLESHRNFVNNRGAGAFQHVDDPGQELWTRFGVTNQSTYVFINDDGEFRVSGYGNLESDIEGLISG